MQIEKEDKEYRKREKESGKRVERAREKEVA